MAEARSGPEERNEPQRPGAQTPRGDDAPSSQEVSPKPIEQHLLVKQEETTVETVRRSHSESISAASPDIIATVEGMMHDLYEAREKNLSKKAQKELAEISDLIPDLVRKNDQHLTKTANLALVSLLTPKPNLILAKRIRRHVQGEVSRWKGPFRAMYRGTPPMRATLGLLTFILLAVLIFPCLYLLPLGTIEGIDGGLLGTSAVLGAVGSIVSVFIRVPRMSDDFRSADQEIPFFVGLFKPMVGIAFAVFLFAAIEGGFVPIAIESGREGAFFIAISFIAGFSERLVPDIIGKVEEEGALHHPRPGSSGR